MAPLSRWLATQPQLAAFEDGSHHGTTGDDQVRLGTSDPTLMGCSYWCISPYIMKENPQPVELRYDVRFSDAQEELRTAQCLRDVSRNLKVLDAHASKFDRVFVDIA
jgi:hypothetical protein